MRNSFKDLEQLELQEISSDTNAIKNGIASDMGLIRYVTSIVEMYFPRIVDMFVGMSGGDPGSPKKDSNRRSRYPDLN